MCRGVPLGMAALGIKFVGRRAGLLRSVAVVQSSVLFGLTFRYERLASERRGSSAFCCGSVLFWWDRCSFCQSFPLEAAVGTFLFAFGYLHGPSIPVVSPQ